MIYQLKAAITGTISEAWLGVSGSEELSAEALTAYQKEIHQRIQYVMDEDPDVERRDPFAGFAKLKEAVEHLHVDAVTEEGKLWACIQAVTQGSLTVGEEKELEVFMQEEFSYGFGEMFPPVKVPEGWVHFRLQEPESCAFTRQNKYEITNIPHPKYPWLHRIRALVHVNERIPAGILGGFVESEANLSQEGKCWVYDNAVCCERAVVEKDAGLFDGAMARASALVTGDACLYDRTEEWAAGKTVDTASLAGRRLAKKSYEKIKERGRGAAAEETAREAAQTTEEAEDTAQRAVAAVKDSLPAAGTERDTAGSAVGHGKTGRDQTAVQGMIKVRPELKESIRTSPRRTVKAPERIKSPVLPSEKVKTGQLAAKQKQALHSFWRARRSAVKAAEAGNTARTAGRSIKTTAKGLKTAVKGAATSVKALGTLLASAGGFILVFIVIIGIIAGAMFSGGSQSAEPLSQEVLNYTPTIQRYASEYGIPDYVPVLQAIMMQESGGRGTDPMQSSECPYNTRFPNSPNAITEPEYSIQVGCSIMPAVLLRPDVKVPMIWTS